MASETCRLYLVTPPALDPDRFRDDLAVAVDAAMSRPCSFAEG